MAQLQVTSQNARKYTVIGLILVTIVAGILAVVIGTQLDRNLSGEDVAAGTGTAGSACTPGGGVECLSGSCVTCFNGRNICATPGATAANLNSICTLSALRAIVCPVASGFYCGLGLGGTGAITNSLYRCKLGEVALHKTCSDGCTTKLQGTADVCTEDDGIVPVCPNLTDANSCTAVYSGTVTYSCRPEGQSLQSCSMSCSEGGNTVTKSVFINTTGCASGRVCAASSERCVAGTTGGGTGGGGGSTNTCPAGQNGLYCGSTLGRDANTLFRCTNGAITTDSVCSNGCKISTQGTGDSCNTTTGGSTGGTGGTGGTTSTCTGGDRTNGCACVRDAQCTSGYCNPSTSKCARTSSCNGSDRPNGCQCGTNNDAVCASGNCQINLGLYRCRPTTGCTGPTGRSIGCFCNQNNNQCASGLCDQNTFTCITTGGDSGGGGGIGGGSGTLPSTGIFDEDSRALLLGLILLILGTIAYIATKSNQRETMIAAKSTRNVYNDIDPDIMRIINSQKKK